MLHRSLITRTLTRPAPRALLLALATFAVAERVLWTSDTVLRLASSYTPPDPDSDPLRIAARTHFLEADPPPVLLLGSSQVREGLGCAPFATRLQRPCVNLGISAGSPVDMETIARDTTARAPRRTLVVGLFPKIMHIALKPAWSGPRVTASVFRTGAWRGLRLDDWNRLGFGAVSALSPTLRHKEGVRGLMAAVRSDPRAALRGDLPPQRERLLDESDRKPPVYFQRRIGVLDQDEVASPLMAVHEDALERLIAGEAGRGGAPVIVDFPTRPGYLTTVPAEARLEYERLMARLAARRDIVFVPASALPPLHESDFLDFTHLSQSGREKVSTALADIVARSPAASAR